MLSTARLLKRWAAPLSRSLSPKSPRSSGRHKFAANAGSVPVRRLADRRTSGVLSLHFASGEPRVNPIRTSFVPLASVFLCALLSVAGCSKKTQEKTQKTIDDAKAAASGAAQDAKQQASDAADKAKQQASDATDQAKQKASDASAAASAAAQKAGEKAQQSASDAAAQAMEAAKEKAKKAAADAKAATDQAMEAAKKKAQKAAADAKKAADDAAAKMQNKPASQ